MSPVPNNLQAVKARIHAAMHAAGRPPESVRLLAVSKTKPASDVAEAVAAGQLAFGENYVQEGVDKIAELTNLRGPNGEALEWHFIGLLQSNKTRPVAEHFHWVHSIDRLKIAERLSAQRPETLPPLQVCVQVNISDENSKSGCAPTEALDLCRQVAALPRLTLRGLMAIPAPAEDEAGQRAPCRALRQLFDEIKAQPWAAGLPLDTLSVGMSHDLEAAITEGSTMVRIGTAIFGERNTNP